MAEPKKSATQVSKKSADRSAAVSSKTDWQAVERDYRTGRYTLRELEAKHGADNGLISRKAKRDGWVQDLSIAIRQATKAKLARQADPAADAAVVEEVAEINKTIILEHQALARRSRLLSASMLGELEKWKPTTKTLGARIKAMRSLSDSIARVVAIEREAFDIAPAGTDQPPPEQPTGPTMQVDILAIRAKFQQALGQQPVVVSA